MAKRVSRRDQGTHFVLEGIRFVVDPSGAKTAVVIELDRHAELWEDFFDCALVAERAPEPRESLESVKARLRARKKRAANA